MFHHHGNWTTHQEALGGETTKGVFQCQPALARNTVTWATGIQSHGPQEYSHMGHRNTVTWATSIVLGDLKHVDIVQELSLKDLTLKLVTLLAPLQGREPQTMQLFDLRNRSAAAKVYMYRRCS